MTEERLVVNVKELQKMLNLSKGLTYSLVKRVDFPAIKIQNRIIIPISELKTWLSKNCMK